MQLRFFWDCSQRRPPSHLVNHVQRALEDGVEDLGDLTGDVASQLVDNGRHGAEHLGLSGGGNVALIVYEDGVEERRDKVLADLGGQRGQSAQKRNTSGPENLLLRQQTQV